MAKIDILSQLTKADQVNVAMSKSWEAFVRALIKSGRYDNCSEVVRAGLRLLQTEHTLFMRAEQLVSELDRAVAEAKRLQAAAKAQKSHQRPRR